MFSGVVSQMDNLHSNLCLIFTSKETHCFSAFWLILSVLLGNSKLGQVFMSNDFFLLLWTLWKRMGKRKERDIQISFIHLFIHALYVLRSANTYCLCQGLCWGQLEVLSARALRNHPHSHPSSNSLTWIRGGRKRVSWQKALLEEGGGLKKGKRRQKFWECVGGKLQE